MQLPELIDRVSDRQKFLLRKMQRSRFYGKLQNRLQVVLVQGFLNCLRLLQAIGRKLSNPDVRVRRSSQFAAQFAG